MCVRLIYYLEYSVLEQILDIFKNNEFFQGGFLVAVMSGVLFYLKSIPSKLLYIFDRMRHYPYRSQTVIHILLGYLGM